MWHSKILISFAQKLFLSKVFLKWANWQTGNKDNHIACTQLCQSLLSLYLYVYLGSSGWKLPLSFIEKESGLSKGIHLCAHEETGYLLYSRPCRILYKWPDIYRRPQGHIWVGWHTGTVIADIPGDDAVSPLFGRWALLVCPVTHVGGRDNPTLPLWK